MIRNFSFIFCFLCSLTSIAQNNFSPRQKAWLYRVTAQTTALQTNCAACFNVNTEPFTNYGPNGKRINFNLGEELLTAHPDSLTIDFECLRTQSHGVLAELAVKTSIWELARTLKRAISNLPANNDSVFQELSAHILKKLPPKEQRKPQSKRTLMTMAVVMHPSLPFTIKQEKLRQMKHTPLAQKAMFDEWSRLTAQWTLERSLYYFNSLTQQNAFYALKMLAAGDGSGTSGILYEYEPHPTDTTRNGYGVGIGLFTYRYATKGETVVTLPQTATTIPLPNIDTVAVHCSLFGLDSSRKPVVVFTMDDKSYHLFSGLGALTPNPIAEDGLSHIDRIRQTTQARINKPLQNLDKDGGLNAILERELNQKEAIEKQLRTLENEIDSLQKETPPNQTAIDVRKRQINTLLTNLTAKERRVAEVSRKLANAYKKIDQSRSLVAEMESLLGPNPQPYTQSGNTFTFADGTIFDQTTQDFFFARQKNTNELSIRLIPASMTMGGTSKDEVQLFVNTTEAKRKRILDPAEPTIALALDTTIYIHYAPDKFKSTTSSTLNDLATAASHFTSVIIVPQTIAMLNEPHRPQKYASMKRELLMPLTSNGQMRQTALQVQSNGDTLVITITSSTDNVATRLSQLTQQQRQQLGIEKPQWKNNQWLAWLRAAAMAHQLAELIPTKATINVAEENKQTWDILTKIGAF
jgi:hypothetical protein